MKHGLLILLFVLVFVGCKQSKDSTQKIKEGSISFDVSYFASEKDNPIIALLPNKVELKFKNNNISLNSEGYLGFFSTRFISIYHEENSHILLKVLNNKFDYEFPKNKVPFIYNQLTPLNVEYSDSTKLIAGYQCKMAKVLNPEVAMAPIIIFYTSEIDLKDPNRNTPLSMIPGVLLQFETTINQVRTKFTAQEIRSEIIPDEEFQIPKDYILSDLESLKKYMVNFK